MKSNVAIIVIGAFLSVGLGTPAVSDQIKGTGTLSGVVSARSPLLRPSICASNTDKKIRYMVFTTAGHYDFINLFPGHYEVTVDKNGFAADKKNSI